MPPGQGRDHNPWQEHRLWRAIAANGGVLYILVQIPRKRESRKALLQKTGFQTWQSRVVVSDKLPRYIKPVKTLVPDADHRAHKGLKNAIEVSHRPTRKTEKLFGKFGSVGRFWRLVRMA